MDKYLIKSDEILFRNGEVKDTPDSHLKPKGPYLINELSDTMYHKDEVVGYHEHSKGIETFMLVRGSVEVTIRGKRCVLTPGDILHLPPYTSHRFRYLEDGTMWRELFQDLNMHQGLRNKRALERCFPDKFNDEEFLKAYRTNAGTIPRIETVPETVDKSVLHEVRTPEFAYSTHTFGGVTFRQKVGRWETNGIKEIWEVIFDEGVKVSCTEEPDPSSGLFSITKGSFEFTVAGQTFVASATDLVNIPEYTSFEIKSLEKGSTILDLNCQAYMLRLLEDIEAYSSNEPDKLKDKDFVKRLLMKHCCYVTGYEK